MKKNDYTSLAVLKSAEMVLRFLTHPTENKDQQVDLGQQQQQQNSHLPIFESFFLFLFFSLLSAHIFLVLVSAADLALAIFS